MNNENQVTDTGRTLLYAAGGALVAACLGAGLYWVNARGFGLGSLLSLIIVGAAIGLSFVERSIEKEERRFHTVALGVVLGATVGMIINFVNEIAPVFQLLFVFAGALIGMRSNK